VRISRVSQTLKFWTREFPDGSSKAIPQRGGNERREETLTQEATQFDVTYLFLASLFGLLLLASTNIWAHAYLVKSIPNRRAVLSRPPTRIQLWFNERLEAQFSSLSVWNAEEKGVDSGDVQVDSDDLKKLSVGVPTLAPGIYTVRFRVLSVDSHIVESSFTFTVRRSQ